MSLLHLPAASGPKVIAEWKSKCFELTNLVRDTEQKVSMFVAAFLFGCVL
jgi:hypothetical protein